MKKSKKGVKGRGLLVNASTHNLPLIMTFNVPKKKSF